jgi:hypothetical protein
MQKKKSLQVHFQPQLQQHPPQKTLLFTVVLSKERSCFSWIGWSAEGGLNDTIEDESTKYHDGEAYDLNPWESLPTKVQRHYPNEQGSVQRKGYIDAIVT